MEKIYQVLVGDIASKGLLFLVNLVLIGLLPVSEYAIFSLLFNSLLLGYQLVCSAIERLYIANYSQFESYSQQVLLFSIVFYTVVFVVYLYDSVSLSNLGLFIVGLSLLSVYQHRRIRFQQQLRFSWFSIGELIKNGGWLVLIVALYMIQSEVSTTDALCAFFASVIIGLIAMPTKTDQVTAGSGLPAPQITFSVIVGSKEVFVYSLLAAVIPFLPILFANHERNVELLATYGAAMRYQAVLGFFVYALNTVCLPVLASAGRREDMILQVRRFYRAIPLVIVAGAMAIGAVILIIPLIDGGKYPKLPLVFLILSGCSLLSLVAVPLINLLLVERQYKQILLCMVLGFIVNLVSYALMRGRLGGYEIATASLLGYVVVNALVMCLGRDRYRRESHRLMT